MNLLNSSLPKWPEMRTIGTKITPEQAGEIIIRCDSTGMFFSNDKEWERQLDELFGTNFEDFNLKFNACDELRARLECLDLEYIKTSRIASCYIGGPHGWVNWDGTIGENGHNIGKWPDCETVFEEWESVAKAFPYLDMRCQLFDKEGCEEGGKVVIEYVIKDGKVSVVEPVDIIPSTYVEDFSDIWKEGRERGASFETIERAYRNCLRNKR